MVPSSTAPIELVLRFAGMAVMFQVMAIVIFRRQVEASPFRGGSTTTNDPEGRPGRGSETQGPSR
ncbi:hypothetical protein GCM10010385_54230 [Streptomyces geysiriensis]|nr:hypothetical protein GCM10010385_54230 [Streptomyces geysiriensis]